MANDPLSESQICITFPLASTGDAASPKGLSKGPKATRQRSSPSDPYEISPKSVKNAKAFRPSVATLGDAGLFELCSFCLRGRGTSRRHMILPVGRSSMMTYTCSASYAVRKIRLVVRTGEEWPGGRAVFQITFFAGPNSEGRPVVSETPKALGPRNCGQSAARTQLTEKRRIARAPGMRTVYSARIRPIQESPCRSDLNA